MCWSAQVLRQTGYTLSGPGDFLLLFSLKTWHTSSSLIFSAVWGRGGCWRCQWLCGEVSRVGVGCFSKPTVKLIKMFCQLLILQSAGGWCLVICNVF